MTQLKDLEKLLYKARKEREILKKKLSKYKTTTSKGYKDTKLMLDELNKKGKRLNDIVKNKGGDVSKKTITKKTQKKTTTKKNKVTMDFVNNKLNSLMKLSLAEIKSL